MLRPSAALYNNFGPGVAQVCLSTAHPCKFEEALRETGLGDDFWQGSSGLAGTLHMPVSAQALQTMDEIFQEEFLAVPGVEPCSYFVAIECDRGCELKLDIYIQTCWWNAYNHFAKLCKAFAPAYLPSGLVAG